ncbi:PAS domain-containing protein [Polyangium spumosum]|uniref:PAS domain-containing protein n=1 Tax=Polyangium spumosum TaxID=889282 RepID=A0A6N7PNN3_9BACT|nr:PAS domain-containing protein [Polyangium spumosum]MRG93623.1 PAS domain-containing protein [Polyangium spumosum]
MEELPVDVQEIQALQEEAERLRARVTELEAALAAATRRVTLHEAFLEDLPVPVVVTDAAGVVVEINKKSRESLGVPSRELVVGKHNVLHNPSSAASGYTGYIERALRGEAFVTPPTSYDVADTGFGRKREVRWAENAFQPIDVDGERYVLSVNVDVTERVRALRAQEESQQFLRGIVENAPSLVYVKDLAGRYLLVNNQFEQFAHMDRASILGMTDAELFGEHAEEYMEADGRVARTGTPLVREDVLPMGDRVATYVTTKFPLQDIADKTIAVCSISVDVTEQKEAEARARKLQDEVMSLQEATLRALSTPLLPIAEGVVVMPLIGNIDARRAEQVLETLLPGIVENHASIVILDVTGVPVVDAQVANALVQAARAVELLGAEVVLTGIQPAMARTLVDIGIELGRIRTQSTLRGGIAIALARGARTRR